MKEKISLNVDIKDAMAKLEGLTVPMLQAWKQTMRRTGRWIITHTARGTAEQTNIPVKVIKSRLRLYFKEGDAAKVWFGVDGIIPHMIQAAEVYPGGNDYYRSSLGVQTGKNHEFRSNWVIWPHRSAWLDRHDAEKMERRRLQGLPPPKPMPKGPVMRRVKEKGRFPIERVYLNIEKQGRIAFKNVMKDAKDELLKKLGQAVNYEIHKVLSKHE